VPIYNVDLSKQITAAGQASAVREAGSQPPSRGQAQSRPTRAMDALRCQNSAAAITRAGNIWMASSHSPPSCSSRESQTATIKRHLPHRAGPAAAQQCLLAASPSDKGNMYSSNRIWSSAPDLPPAASCCGSHGGTLDGADSDVSSVASLPPVYMLIPLVSDAVSARS
jgi:hypothetical protein